MSFNYTHSHDIITRSLIPSWNEKPIPNLILSAGGLLALADLNTIAQRTLLSGGSSWLDALVLAPGLHYQQAIDAIGRQTSSTWTRHPSMTEAQNQDAPPGNRENRPGHLVLNDALLFYLMKLSNQLGLGVIELEIEPDTTNWVDEFKGLVMKTPRARKLLRSRGKPELEWISHLLYLASPLLTIVALVLMVLFEDWWGFGVIIALMISRLLNIWVIKQRSQPTKPLVLPLPTSGEVTVTEFDLDLGDKRHIILRGSRQDLEIVTSQAWLRSKSHLDGYFEALAKIIVYLVAAFSGNLTQVGALTFMGLLLTSVGLLGLSNAKATEFRSHGRLARPLFIKEELMKAALSKNKDLEHGH